MMKWKVYKAGCIGLCRAVMEALIGRTGILVQVFFFFDLMFIKRCATCALLLVLFLSLHESQSTPVYI